MADGLKDEFEVIEPQGLLPRTQQGRGLVAPWWHTAIVVLLIAGTSVLGSRQSTKQSMGAYHLANYGVTIAWEWVLAAIVYGGIRLKRTPLRELLGERRRGLRELLTDVGAAAIFWIASILVLGVLAALLKLLHLGSAQKQLSQLAPSGVAEAALWITLSVSAGICEEFIFRGYFQQQFARATGRVWIGVIASALLFGAAHGYEGIAGMLMITVYGALFSLLAIRRRSLRAGMIAHGWHDSFTGIALWFLKRANVPLGIG